MMMSIRKRTGTALAGLALAWTAMAQTVIVSGTCPDTDPETLSLHIVGVGGSDQQSPVKATVQGSHFSAEITASTNGFYLIAGAHNGGQLLLPVYWPQERKRKPLTLRLADGAPMVSGDDDNEALSAYNRFTYSQSRTLWNDRQRVMTVGLKPFLMRYQQVADSIAAHANCIESVRQYIRLWAMADATTAYDAIPRALDVGSSVVDFPLNDLMPADADRLLQSPLVVSHAPLVRTIMAGLPKAGLIEKLQALYDGYTNPVIRECVADRIVSNWISRFNFADNYDAGLAELSSAVDKFKLDRRILSDFTSRRALTKGAPFPDNVSLVDVNGQQVSLKQFSGKIVYVDLWASWCVPCIREVPYLQQLERELNGSDIAFVSVSIDTKADAWKKKMAALNMSGHQFLCQDNAISKAYNVQAIPFFLIFDREGCLLMANAPRPSHPELKSLLEKLATEKAAK